ncbi:MAG TPA: glycosyltransferase family 39 protein [Terriglobales bacterium]|nr:glycosyltransferase family 39 protein [Terriglobales bacterium]
MGVNPPAVPNAKGRGELAVVAMFAAAKLLLHLGTASNYGYFRDELYFIAASDHLDWGYVDMAPMIAWVTRLMRLLLGDSLFAIHVLPALAGAGKIVLTGLIVRELGGRRFAIALACLAVMLAPVHVVVDSLLSMNTLEQLLWTACAYCVVLAIRREQPKYWLWFGALAGLGLETKHSMLFFGFAVFAGLLLTRERRVFRGKHIWIAGAIALLLFLPNVVWQVQHGYPTLEGLRNVQRQHKNVVFSPPQFLVEQVMLMLPTSAPLWVAGLWFYFFDKGGRRYRVLGWTYIVLLIQMMVLHGKPYYLAPIYPMLLAGGAVWVEELADGRRWRWLKPVSVALILPLGVVSLPAFLPLLPPEQAATYMDRMRLRPSKTEVGHLGALPQYFGDRFGWPEMVEAVARAYNALPPEERAQTGIFANNYGEAGAIDLLGRKYGLPKATSPHQNYFYWGPGEQKRNYIVLQDEEEDLRKVCDSVEVVAVLDHPYAMEEERRPVHLCRGVRLNLKERWPSMKHWN